MMTDRVGIDQHETFDITTIEGLQSDAKPAKGAPDDKVGGHSTEKDAATYLGASRGQETLDSSYGMLLGLLERGAELVAESPRDVPAFNCLYGLLVFLNEKRLSNTLPDTETAHKFLYSRDQIFRYATRCLLRCLTISYQTTSTGMTGWLEYGSYTNADRVLDRPFSILQNLACIYASSEKWQEAEDVLAATVLRCEQQLPLYHPLTLVSMLDLAGAATMNSQPEFASKLIVLVYRRFSFYLSEVEGMCFDQLEGVVTAARCGAATCRIDSAQDAFYKLQAFVTLLRYQSKRKMFAILGRWHEISLVFHSLVADATAVLANCTKAAESMDPGGLPEARQSAYFWRIAFAHYTIAFRGLSRTGRDQDIAFYTAAYGLARCLREMGDGEKALGLLSSVVDEAKESPGSATADTQPQVKADVHAERPPVPLSSVVYLPGNHGKQDEDSFAVAAPSTTREMSIGLCYWLMAVLAVDVNPSARGRSLAVRYLRESSGALQRSLRILPAGRARMTRIECVRLLRAVEAEGERILDGMGPPAFDSLPTRNHVSLYT